MKMINMFSPENRRDRTSMTAVVVLVASLTVALFATPAQAVIVYTGASSGANNALPTDTTAGALTINIPAGTVAGQALIASIAARPSGMTVTVPANWFPMTVTQQPSGGVSTLPGGMTLLTYYHIVGTAEPASYTWTFANTAGSGASYGGSAVGGLLAFSGIDTSSGNPIDVWSALLNANAIATGITTTPITPTVTNTMIVSSLSYLSGDSFNLPTLGGVGGILTRRLDQRAPVAVAAVGTTIQMSTTPWATATSTGAARATAVSNDDTGVGHLMALKPSLIDPSILMTRSGALIPGGSAFYTLTVTNNGINAEPGAITVVDTLPAGLTYNAAGSGGTGWVCGAVGQVVTCTRAGALAAGATAAALVLNVNVSAGASGTLTNTATVSGTGGDGNTANNTATDSYTIPLQSYAYYTMDETTWGTVTDSSGNGRDGTALGAAAPTGYPPASPPGSAIAGSPGTCGAGRIPVTAGSGVDTTIDINSLGNAGSITLWYSSNSSWTDGNDRMLLDASNNLGNGGADKHFYLVKGDNGELRFGLEDSGDNDELISSGANNFPANQWHHIAITWDWNVADRIYLYLDGVAVVNTGLANNIGNFATLYLGTTHSNIAGFGTDFTTNTANGYLDEVRVYASALTAAQITADMNATHSCGSVDHYELSLPTSSITCLPTTATVTACANNSSPCTSPYALANGTTADLATDGGALGATTVTFNASGVATTTLSYPGATNNTSVSVSLSGEDLPAASPRQCCPDGVSCVAANSCSTTFNTAGFIFASAANGAAATIPSQVAGVSSITYYLRAVKTSTTTQACESALVGANTVNFAYECNNPTTCSGSNLMSVNGGTATTIARNDNGSVSSYSSVSMIFDVNGNAPFTFNFSDVGQVKLYASKAAGGSLLSALTGSSNAFVVKPAGFTISNIVRTSDSFANPAASDATGGRFIGAGEAFTITVKAVASDGTTATPNFGKESTPAGVLLTRTLVAPPVASGGQPGSLSNATIPGTEFGSGGMVSDPNGSATVTNLSWSEVGIITLTGSMAGADYLGGGNVPNTYTSVNIGRFSPSFFDITTVTSGCNSSFTYAGLMPVGLQPSISGQPFTVIATAKNLSGTPTLNFDGILGFAKDTTFSDAGTATNFTNNTLLGTGYTLGVGQNSLITYRFDSKETVPQTLTLRAVDSDSVSSASHAELTTVVRSGRVHIFNAYGSELVNLPVPMRAEYYDASSGWITNPNDGCTSIALGNLTPANPIAVVGSSPVKTTNASITNATFVVGDAGLSLSQPGVGGTGYVDLTADLAAKAWLKYDWNGTGTAANPTGRATFGLYRGSPKSIYLRERY